MRALVGMALLLLALPGTLAAQDARATSHTTRHRYSAEALGVDAERMRRELADFYWEYRWDAAS